MTGIRRSWVGREGGILDGNKCWTAEILGLTTKINDQLNLRCQVHSWEVSLGLNVRLLEANYAKQDSKGASVHVPSGCNPLRWVENLWQW